MSMGAWFDNIGTDARQAVRSLRRSPGFAALAILVLAVGIGGTTAIFSVVDATRARSLPYTDPERLVHLIGTVKRGTIERRGASYPDFLDWRAQATRFEGLAAFDSQTMSLAGSEETERIDTEFVSAAYFQLLGTAPALGRVFTPGEDEISKPSAVTVLSDGLWRRRFAADPQIVGTPVTLNGRPFTVVGVMPSGFTGVTDSAQLWLPFAQWAPERAMTNRGQRGFSVLARLEPGVSLAAAQSEVDTIASRLERAYPASNEARGIEVSPLAAEVYGPMRIGFGVLLGAIALVLVIACANVANLLIARSEVRRREIALRVAIGAGRGRLLQQLVTESCVLTSLGAVASVLLAQAIVTLVLARSPVPFPSTFTPGLDARVALFTMAVSLLCGIAVGTVPWWHIGIVDLGTRLRESARGSDAPRSQRLRSSLVVAEVALAIVLLVGAGLMIQSVRKAAAVDPGFDPESLLTIHVSVPRVGTPPAAQPAPSAPAVKGRELVDRIRSVAGVVSVGLGTGVPLDGGAGAGFFVVEGQGVFTAQNRPRAFVHGVLPEFFAALRIPVVRGRTFLPSEIDPTSPAVIVSQRLVDRFWPDQDPLGKRLKFGDINSKVPWLSIVGVVRETKFRRLPENPTADPDIYIPFVDRNSQFAFAVRTSVPPASTIAQVRAAIRAADPGIAIYGVATMSDEVDRQTAPSRFVTWIMGVFAFLALGLCALGIYGVTSYAVTQRTREIGIRLALGAQPREVLRAIVAGGARLIAAGIVIGTLASVALRRAVSAQVFDVPFTDPATGLALALFALVGLAACVVPAFRATRLDPVRALHQE
jgi:putative ABC transport system permease protein